MFLGAFETNVVEPSLIRPRIETSETAPGVFLSELRASRDVASQIARCVIFKDRLSLLFANDSVRPSESR